MGTQIQPVHGFRLKITGKSGKEPKQSLVELDWTKTTLENE